jgi:hypothetical protein
MPAIPKTAWIVSRCTPYESVTVHTFTSEHEALSACKTLVRMSSSEREYWYEVSELIEFA